MRINGSNKYRAINNIINSPFGLFEMSGSSNGENFNCLFIRQI